jgi:hypothetical protein
LQSLGATLTTGAPSRPPIHGTLHHPVSLALSQSTRITSVVETLQPEAQQALAAAPTKRLTATEAARLAGRQLPKSAEYVLLRAVVLNENTGGFQISVQGTSVNVYHGCLGIRPVRMMRKALVAALAEVPDVVFVSCSMAE